MNRPILVCALLLMTAATLGAQEASESSPYQGTSTPPPDDTIVTTSTPQAKPPAGRKAVYGQNQVRLQAQNKAPVQAQPAYTVYNDPAVKNSDPDSGIVGGLRSSDTQQPVLTKRNDNADPDSDIVHLRPPRPGELPEGTTIRVRLLDSLSSATNERGDTFRCRVASDVMQGDRVMIPAGAEIDGRVMAVSSGHFGGHGSMHLLPERVILANGKSYQLRAVISSTPGAKSKVGSEGTILPASRMKRNSIEYGGAVGGGAATGAILGGPVGAFAGGMVGAGIVTVHLLTNHPQAKLEPGTAMVFTLTEPLQMAAADTR
ncbi:MAG TPA: hypothetical protein VKF63_08350 [Terracidiphilus sp.]|nr:hypothetical protein [Terracidiphilus sp.]